MRSHKRGFTIIETLVAIAIVVTAFLVVLAVFAMSIRQATQTRSNFVALMLANTLLEEFQAHPYGTTAPGSWTRDVTVSAVIEGRPSSTTFHKNVTYANGSLVGSGSGATSDTVTATITWQDGSVGNPDSTQRSCQVQTTVHQQP